MNMTLPTDSEERKGFPLLGGVLRYFPAALAGVARWSKLGNDKHNPGQPLHHSRGKSMDHGDCILRHLMDLQDLLAYAEDGNTIANPYQQLLDEADALAWRSLALSQELHERFGAPLAPGAKLPKTLSSKMRDTGLDMRNARKGTSELANDEPQYSTAPTADIPSPFDGGARMQYPTEQQTQKPRIREVWALQAIGGGGFVDDNRKLVSSFEKAKTYTTKDAAEIDRRRECYLQVEAVKLP